MAAETTVRPVYVCENCGRLGPLTSFHDDCRPGWTHGRLTKVESFVNDPARVLLAEVANLDNDIGDEWHGFCERVRAVRAIACDLLDIINALKVREVSPGSGVTAEQVEAGATALAVFTNAYRDPEGPQFDGGQEDYLREAVRRVLEAAREAGGE